MELLCKNRFGKFSFTTVLFSIITTLLVLAAGCGGGRGVGSSLSGNETKITFEKTFGGTNNDFGKSVQQTTDGGYIILGHTSSFGAGSGDMYLVKTDASGTQMWSKTFGGASNDRGYSVQQTTDGGYILLGHTSSFGAGQNDMYLVKTDSNGTQQWSKTFGGAYGDRGSSVQQTTDGGYIILGDTGSSGAGGYDMYLVKTDANGNVAP